MPITVLVLTAIVAMTTAGRSAILNPGQHGFSEGTVLIHFPGK
jgi:K+-transporting ATPase A subunit